jgi:hypothetical protein
MEFTVGWQEPHDNEMKIGISNGDRLTIGRREASAYLPHIGGRFRVIFQRAVRQ